jgi:hypothetical protein
VVAAAALLSGCSSSDAPQRAGLLHPRWHEITLPVPPGPPGRIAVRDATACDGTWWVVGAIVGDSDASRPAAWTSTDGQTWRSVSIHPTDYYARRATLYSVACREGQVVAVGAKSGGAHANPRTATWRLRQDDVLQDVTAPFILYGGEHAISVNRVAAGPDGWVIAGNRSSGAAAWVAGPGAESFRIVDHDPELASDATRATTALDVVHDGTAWTVVGRTEASGRTSPGPQAWTSTDGSTWTSQRVPASTDGFADLERVTRDGDDLLAAGIRDDRFGTWRRTGNRWQASGSFGVLAHATSPPFVSGLVAASGKVVLAASDGAVFRLWARTTAHGWQQVATPTRPATTGEDQLTVASDRDTVLLLGDDGTSGRVWTTGWNTLGR